MILVDKDIKQYVDSHQLIVSGFKEENLNGISYDLTMDVMCDEEGKEHREYDLKPGETVFVKTQEKISIPENIVGRIAEKNSRMRQGLVVDGPHYQPGHVTYVFLRVTNISENLLVLTHDMKIAQIMFEKLTQVPAMPYSAQVGASYQNEVSYKGLGNYKEEYEKQTKREIQHAKESIEDLSQKIYANVLTLMGVLVAIFAMISINYQAFTNAKISMAYVLVMNLSMTLCIVVMLGLILIFVNKAKNKKFLWLYICILAVLAIATIGVCIAMI